MKTSPHVDEFVHGKVLEVDLHGKLSREDYDKVIPETERLIRQHGKIRILVTMHEFEGWDAGALWEDVKWEARHFTDIGKLAIVGEESWHNGWPVFAMLLPKRRCVTSLSHSWTKPTFG